MLHFSQHSPSRLQELCPLSRLNFQAIQTFFSQGFESFVHLADLVFEVFRHSSVEASSKKVLSCFFNCHRQFNLGVSSRLQWCSLWRRQRPAIQSAFAALHYSQDPGLRGWSYMKNLISVGGPPSLLLLPPPLLGERLVGCLRLGIAMLKTSQRHTQYKFSCVKDRCLQRPRKQWIVSTPNVLRRLVRLSSCEVLRASCSAISVG